VTNLVSCCITLVRFPDDGPLWTITCRNMKCDFMMSVSKEQVCAFCLCNVMNQFYQTRQRIAILFFLWGCGGSSVHYGKLTSFR